MLVSAPASDEPLANVGAAVEEFCAHAERGFSMESLETALRSICANIDRARIAGSDDGAIRALVRPAYDIHATSAFIQRLQTWPRGYAGDFETIEWIARSHPELDAGHRAYWIEWYALNGVLGQQHRNKLAWQRGLMERAARGGGRILNIGCGGCADVADGPAFLGDCDVVLVDMDADALALAGERLKGARSLKLVRRNVIRGVQEALRLGPFDLILCGGLFDYFPDRTIQKLAVQLTGALSDEGTFAFTNIGDENPLRPWMEYLADWRLIHRDAGLMRELLSGVDISGFDVALEKDASGLTWLCAVSRRT
ncbi:class I SAM-dependent methyltransferase [Methylopila sp. M107]|uniref:class I SAM-dependent methyltransferase n=1 Tax=Methylopila sp. M107 TaxID=1101190 RepID=UPI0003819B16|nr:class I SAM-dependent methyltransferase [Methylopila sp. M107]